MMRNFFIYTVIPVLIDHVEDFHSEMPILIHEFLLTS